MSDRPLLAIPQVMERLNFSYEVVRGLLVRGALPALKVGKAWRVDQDDLDAFLAKQKAAAHRATPGAIVESALDADLELEPVENPFL